ncbi:hypothetical protein B0F90DRAFT_270239 [Multifurca ochricompacta]|uniref:SH3 domain-containing protein n=1 Tax=Multifurca ochricompacta TaxID=376703 RepID=A0AAD4M793_9AGAM|nr:hypothetical protein B0F90DRAFT_270239 [Multifurca ochricompacta]
MPFANLSTHEKDAFFALLDEYFASRPDLLSRTTSDTTSAAAAAAVQRALTNPAASRVLAAGFQRATSAASGTGNPGPPSMASNAVENDHVPPSAPAVGVGRVAAAAQAFSASVSSAPPPPKPANPPTQKRADSSEGQGLFSQKKFGDVDVSSAGAMFRSLRGSTAAKNAPPAPVPVPSAFGAKKNAFAPPPIRRVPTSSSSTASAATHSQEPGTEPEPDVQSEEEGANAGGEWAEALYDYTSEETGDLHLRAGERVRVTEQTSSDWWTGEVGSRNGLFPASYVKLL